MVSRELLEIGGMACLGQEFELVRDKVLSSRTTLVSRNISYSEVETTLDVKTQI